MTTKPKSGLTILPNTSKKDWEQIRFNWGYWQARSDFEQMGHAKLLSFFGPQSPAIVSHAFDPLYYWGYKSGKDSIGHNSDSSAPAFEAYKVSGME